MPTNLEQQTCSDITKLATALYDVGAITWIQVVALIAAMSEPFNTNVQLGYGSLSEEGRQQWLEVTNADFSKVVIRPEENHD